MQQWKQEAGWNTVQSYLRTAARRMVAHAKLATDLTQEQRDLLLAESTRLRAKADEIKTLGRALEDFVDGELGDVRQEAFVWDMVCDDLNQDAWRIMQTKAGQKALAAAGKTREAIFDTTRIKDVIHVGRMSTATITRVVGEGVSKLSELPDVRRAVGEPAGRCRRAASGGRASRAARGRPGGEAEPSLRGNRVGGEPVAQRADPDVRPSAEQVPQAVRGEALPGGSAAAARLTTTRSPRLPRRRIPAELQCKGPTKKRVPQAS